MRHWQPGDGPRPQRPDYAAKAEEFPGPVAIACAPPQGTIALLGFEDTDDHPWAVQVTYAASGRDVLRVRTVRGSIDWPQRIRSVETLATNLSNSAGGIRGAQPGRLLDRSPETPTSIVIDGTPVPATRMDLPDRSGIHVEWQGQHVFCTGEASTLDALELRTGTSADFRRFMAEFEAYIARRRTGG